MNSEIVKMDSKRALSYFMDLSNDRRDFFRYNLASNAVLEWFGRTIRGNEGIERFFRYDVWPQYEQNFVTGTACDPIETKATHEQTKQTPIENSISCPPTFQNKAKAFDSPPPTRRNLSAPPPLIRCKNRIRSSAHDDSEKSSDSDGDEIKTNTKKYNLRRLVGVHEEMDHSRERRTLRKRTVEVTKASELRSISPTKRTKKATDPCAGPSLEKCPSSTRSCSLTKPYSELNYLESIGSIRTIRRAKNPDINKIPTRTQTATPFVSPESQNGWDRKTKLKISYRISTTNENDIQFALIIYEPMTMLIRRNLLEEFQKAAQEEEQERATSTPIVPLPTTPIDSMNRTGLLKTPLNKIKTKIDKPISLRRLRF